MIKNHSCFRGLLFYTAFTTFCAVDAAEYIQDAEKQSIIAMADVGAIKSDSSPSDPAANVAWSELTEQQRNVLSPLSSAWDTLRPWQKEKMLDIAKEYPKMDAPKQQRIQHQLVKWSRMTPYERENARKRYQHFMSLSPEQKEALRKQWREHQKRSAASGGYDPEFDGADTQ